MLLLGPDGGGAARGVDLCKSEVIRVLEEPPDLGPSQMLVSVEPFEAAVLVHVGLVGGGGKGNAGEDIHHVRSVIWIEVRFRLANEVGVDREDHE